MNAEAREKLQKIVEQFGITVSNNPQQLRGLLSDYCGQHKAEINVLVAAASEGVPNELYRIGSLITTETLLARLTNQLCRNLAITEHASAWAVESWALALQIELPQPTAATVVLDQTLVHSSQTPPRLRQSGGRSSDADQFRHAIRIAMADGQMDDSALAVIEELRQRLMLHRKVAAQIYDEVVLGKESFSRLNDEPELYLDHDDPVLAELVLDTDEPVAGSANANMASAAVWSYLQELNLPSSFYRAPAIPEDKLRKLAVRCNLPAGELVFLLADCTIFGSAKNGVLLTDWGVRWHNGWESKVSGAGSIAYQQIIGSEFEQEGKNDLRILYRTPRMGSMLLTLAWGMPAQLLEILTKLRNAIENASHQQ